MKKNLSLILFILFSFVANAQITKTETPYYFTHDFPTEITVVETPTFDAQALLEEDKKEILIKPYRFAKVFPVNINFKAKSIKKEDGNNDVWILKIKSENAKSIGLVFSNIELPEGAKLFIYDENKTLLIGAITNQNNKNKKILPTTYLPTDEIIIEYSEPKNTENKADFIVSQISHDYRGAFEKGDSQDCEVNINCSEGDNWQVVKHSVCKYTYTSDGNSYMCSGALIANTQLDNTPYFLTANHCVSTEDEANSAVFYFNYEATTCSGTTGSTSQTLSGATLVATASNHLDFCLLEMTSTPPQSYQPYYAGWNRGTSAPSNTTCIHHPAGDIKKISKDNNTSITGTFGSGYDSEKHWQIEAWDVGTTEGGSSGSPLFDADQLIIGDLSGGEASCDYNFNDYYQKFDASWDDYSSQSQQLKHWLDPISSNYVTINGYDPYINYDLAPPVNLSYSIENENNITINWLAPGSPTGEFSDSFEDYTNFSLNFGSWTQIDNDNQPSYGSDDFDFTNEGYTGAFIVFTPSSCVPANPTNWESHSGSKYVTCFNASIPDNNDWLITPQLTIVNGNQLSFYAKSVTDQYGLERFTVSISTTGTETSDFTVISEGNYVEPPTIWTKYSYDLSEYADQEIYIAINVISSNAYCFMLDDFEIGNSVKNTENNITTNENNQFPNNSKTQFNRGTLENTVVANLATKNLTGYKLYRNATIYQEFDNTITTFVDSNLDDGIYKYYISAIYTGDEESRPTNQISVNVGVSIREIYENNFTVYPNPNNGVFYINSTENLEKSEIKIYNCKGEIINTYEQNLNQNTKLNLENLPKGIYFIKIISENKNFTEKIIIQ